MSQHEINIWRCAFNQGLKAGLELQVTKPKQQFEGGKFF